MVHVGDVRCNPRGVFRCVEQGDFGRWKLFVANSRGWEDKGSVVDDGVGMELENIGDDEGRFKRN